MGYSRSKCQGSQQLLEQEAITVLIKEQLPSRSVMNEAIARIPAAEPRQN
ncbi:hypothetical protein H6G89_33190 [Oscillatoria sp. FACHB-1407]|nr:hypothetical protein [Oscillatoria sp. FACHB-1407]MBD2465846.1 hypothetical protein [Oscillatoria sp. FACHB-1407]